MTTLAVMGSTGSIGTQTLDIVRADPDAYDVVALAAARSVEVVAAQAAEFHPEVVVLVDADRAMALSELLPPGTELLVGEEGLASASAQAECVINGVVGFAGLPVTLATLEAGHRLGLANKESLISAGPVVQRVRSTPGAELIPVDSEHCALHQCLRANDVAERVHRLVLTASGGPFRGRTEAELAEVTVADALAHPTGQMGPKITVDSSTLMNKGLEVIEACELFGVPVDDVDVVVHPQSVVHSMVTYSDGATIAQLSLPDMRLCIGYALAYPDRLTEPFGAIDWRDLRRLDFEEPDRATFPCLDLAYDAARTGETAPAWLNGANEEAVAAFLDGRIRWAEIAEVLKETLDSHDGSSADSLEAVLAADRRSRDVARSVVERKASS